MAINVSAQTRAELQAQRDGALAAEQTERQQAADATTRADAARDRAADLTKLLDAIGS
jgi:hypothetical protein